MTRKIRFHRGQTALEYVLATIVLLGLVGVMGYLVQAARNSADRAEALVRSDCP